MTNYMLPTQENLKFFTHYNPETGVMKRIRALNCKHDVISCDRLIKSKTSYGYYQLNIFGRPYVLHRLAFLYMEGILPEHDVDHINGDRSDNRWCNLRKVTRMENLHNIGLRKSNSTGHAGISLRTDTGAYHAYIDHNGKRKHLGNFENLDDAIVARKKAEIDFKFHKNHGARPAWQK